MENSFFIIDNPKRCAGDCVDGALEVTPSVVRCLSSLNDCDYDLFVNIRSYPTVNNTCKADGDMRSPFLTLPALPDSALVSAEVILGDASTAVEGPSQVTDCLNQLNLVGCMQEDCACNLADVCNDYPRMFDKLPDLPDCPLVNVTRAFNYERPSLGQPFGVFRIWTPNFPPPKYLFLGLASEYHEKCREFLWSSVQIFLTIEPPAIVGRSTSTPASASARVFSIPLLLLLLSHVRVF